MIATTDVSGPERRRALWQLHACVFLWGFTAILGKLITLSAIALVIWRMAMAVAVLGLLPNTWRGLATLDRRDLARHAFAGSVIALHWLTFYASIKLANASVAVACIALGAVFAALIEPLLTARPHERGEIALGFAVIPGVWLLVGGVPEGMLTGVLVGILSAALTALFSSLNKRYLGRTDPATVSLLQLGMGVAFLAVFGSIVFGTDKTFVTPTARDFSWLALLAVACTVLPFLLWLRALHHVSAFGTQLALNLEPVYAILLAALLFRENEDLTPRFYLGAAAILATVLVQPLLSARRR